MYEISKELTALARALLAIAALISAVLSLQTIVRRALS
jgi:hypothetical protein